MRHLVNSFELLEQCQIDGDQRKECGYMGIKQPECEGKGCCWRPLEEGSSGPWCFFPAKKGEIKKYINIFQEVLTLN